MLVMGGVLELLELDLEMGVPVGAELLGGDLVLDGWGDGLGGSGRGGGGRE